MVGREQLENDLEAAGLCHSDTVLVHSAVSAIGAVGGAETILDVLEGYFCRDGLLVVPTMTYTLVHSWDPESERCAKCSCPRKYCFAFLDAHHLT